MTGDTAGRDSGTTAAGEAPEVAALRAEVDRLSAQLEAQQAVLARQGALLDALLDDGSTVRPPVGAPEAPAPIGPDDASPDRRGDDRAGDRALDRRRLLTAGGLTASALAGSAALSVLGASPAAAASVGGLTLLDFTTRIYDSRAGFQPNSVTKGAWKNEERTVVTTTYVPEIVAGTTKAVLLNLAVTNTVGGGFGGAFRPGIAWPGNASVNWSGSGITISNLVVVAVDASANFRLKIAGTADVIIDAIGYFS